MKKLLILLLVLIVIGGVVFYFGWIQLLIPPGSCAVIHTKTGGYEKKIIPAGTFAWRAERLIPANMSLFIFPIQPVDADSTTLTGTMPSGPVYGSSLAGSPDFSYKIRIRITFSLNPEVLPDLVSGEGLRPEGLDGWYQKG